MSTTGTGSVALDVRGWFPSDPSHP